MARSKRLALNEAIKKGQKQFADSLKSGQLRSSELEKPPSTVQETREDVARQRDEVIGARPGKLRAQSIVSRRLILSMPYPVAGILLVAIILVFLMVFKLGQIYGQKERQLAGPEVGTGKMGQNEGQSVFYGLDKKGETSVDVKDRPVSKKEAQKLFSPVVDHVILIKEYHKRRDLEPVQEYFRDNGIKTEIQEGNGVYFLETKDKYESPEREGTDGYFALQRIKEIGINYKAQQGYETFGVEPFQDAYGKKIR